MARKKRRSSAKGTSAPSAEPPAQRPIAPKPAASSGASYDASGDGYREATREEKPLRPPSDIPAARAPVWRTRALVVAAWTVLVVRFAMAIRVHGLTGRAALVGALSSLAILPIVIGAVLLLVPNR